MVAFGVEAVACLEWFSPMREIRGRCVDRVASQQNPAGFVGVVAGGWFRG